MNASVSPESPDGYGEGDLAGLDVLGRQAGCLNEPLPT